MDFLTSAVILAWIAITVMALAMAGLLRQVLALTSGRQFQQQIGPVVGSIAPLVPDLERVVKRGSVTLMLFLDTACDVCLETLRVAEERAHNSPDWIRFVGIFPTDVSDVAQNQVEIITGATDIFASYNIPVTPFGVTIGVDGRISRAGALGSPELLDAFVDDTTEDGG
jgi:hypothetical protein